MPTPTMVNANVIKILSAKTLTMDPADGIDNFTRAVFGRMRSGRVQFFAETEAGVPEVGALGRLAAPRAEFLRHEKPDLLWGIGRANELPLIVRRPRGTMYVINFHTLLYRKTVGAWAVRTPWFVRKFIFNQATVIFCPSEFSAASVRRYFPKQRVVSILNGVDLNLFNPAKAAAQKNDTRAIVAFVGALQSRKRPEVFIELAGRFPEAQFVMVGRRDPAYDVLPKAEGLKNFRWVERMSREEVAAFLATAKAFIFPSLNEPAAAVILEAMASGCVPILSASGGNGEFLDGVAAGASAAGFLVPNDAAELDAFTAALRKLLENPTLAHKMSAVARYAAESHSWNMVAEQYEKHILELCQRNP